MDQNTHIYKQIGLNITKHYLQYNSQLNHTTPSVICVKNNNWVGLK